MKLTLSIILAFVTVALAVIQPQKAVIISYPDNTPEQVLEKAKQAIIDAGGMITHEYKLIKFVAPILVTRLSHPAQRLTSCLGDSLQRRQPRFSSRYRFGAMTTTPLSKKTKWCLLLEVVKTRIQGNEMKVEESMKW